MDSQDPEADAPGVVPIVIGTAEVPDYIKWFVRQAQQGEHDGFKETSAISGFANFNMNPFDVKMFPFLDGVAKIHLGFIKRG